MFTIRRATPADLAAVTTRTRLLNADEGIEIEDAVLDAAALHLLRSPDLGAAWLIERAGVPVGHAVVTYGYDLEFGGRDSFLTELWVDPPARHQGAAAIALDLIARELRAADIRAVHLQVRPDNPARRVYERAGFETSPRVVMTRRL